MINYEEIARDLYALGSYAMIGLLIAALALLKNTGLLIELVIALGLSLVISAIFDPDDRIVRIIIGLTTLALLGGTLRAYVLIGIVAVAALVMSERYLDRDDVWHSALIGGLVQSLALLVAAFI